ncbi:MAG TPA: aminotransferase class V-fold PLP-dependent enzyme [Gemmatimonadales bacterium]
MSGERLARIERPLRYLFRTTRPVMILPATGGGGLEAGIRNGVDERLLVVVGGKAGEEAARVAEACGKEVVRAFVAPGAAIEPPHLERFLDGPEVDAVLVPHVDPGTGAVAPLAELARVVRQVPDTLLLVDARCSLGAERLETDLWQVDYAFAEASAIGGAPGCALAVASKRMIERSRKRADRGWYFDLPRIEDELRARTLSNPPTDAAMAALEAALDALAARGGITAAWRDTTPRRAPDAGVIL